MPYIEFDHSRPLDIVLLGRIAIDFNPAYSESVKEEFKPLKDVHYFEKYVGGSPANIAVGVTRHGLKAGFIGKVSDDQFGDYVTEYFDACGIDTSHVTRCTNGEKIGLTFTEMLSPSESSILMYRNCIADLQLSVDDIDPDYIASAKLLLISGTALAQSPSREAAIVMGSREEFDLTEALIHPGMSDEESALYWQGHRAKIVVIKHGMQGSTAYCDDGEKYSIKPFPVTARKGFGGGDGYGSGFLFGLFQGWEIQDCLEFGSAEASMMVRANNCSDALPGTEEVHAFIAEEKAQFGEMVAHA